MMADEKKLGNRHCDTYEVGTPQGSPTQDLWVLGEPQKTYRTVQCE